MERLPLLRRHLLPVLYIREKGVNENAAKRTELKLPYTVASATVSRSGVPSEKIVAYSGK